MEILEKYWRDRIAYPYEHGNSFGAGENLGGTAVDVVSFAVGGAGIVKGVAKAIEAGNTLSAIRAAGRAAPEAELAAEYIRLPSQLPAGFDPATPIGQFAVPPDLIPGTAPFGIYAHQHIADLLQAAAPDVKFEFRVNPGQTGIDITVPSQSAADIGFEFGEIKPLSVSGLRRFNTQMRSWNPPGPVTAITYDASGRIYLDFPGVR